MALAKLCRRHGPQPPGPCPECERARWRDDGARRRAKHDPRDDVYQSVEWGRLRLKILRRDKFRCQYAAPGCLGQANVAAHIQPHAGTHDPLAWDEANLIASCAYCNRQEQAHRA